MLPANTTTTESSTEVYLAFGGSTYETIKLGPLTTTFTYPDVCSTPLRYLWSSRSTLDIAYWDAECLDSPCWYDPFPTLCYPPSLGEVVESILSVQDKPRLCIRQV